MAAAYISPCLSAPQRSLHDVRLELIEKRVALLIRQMNARAEARWCESELAAIERRLAMVDGAIS